MKASTKSPSESYIEMREIVLPQHSNAHGTIFGGTVMSWIDIAAAMVAQKHCNMPCVTVSVDSISFNAPIKIGNHVYIQAKLIYTGKTSMEVYVKVFSENPYTANSSLTTEAFLTFVGLDDNGKPSLIPQLTPQTDEEKKNFVEGKKRSEERKRLKK